MQRNPPNLQAVAGVIIGSMQVAGVQGLASPVVKISVEFETNYTEVVGGNGSKPGEMTYYVRERWVLERKKDVLSPPPAQATALHCPRCGAALMKDTTGACAFCGAKIESGEFQWFVRGINLKERIRRIAPFSLSVAVDFACALAEALNYAHSMGQPHGDLRPQNVIVSPEGAVKVTDRESLRSRLRDAGF